MTTTFWQRIPETWQMVLAVSAIFGGGTTVGAFVTGFSSLPERVEAVEDRQAATEKTMQSIQQNIRLNNCLLLATRRGTDPMECAKLVEAP